jgi:hypothetical protein
VPVSARGVLQIRSADAEHVIALYNPLLLVYFGRAPTDEELTALRKLVNETRSEVITGGMLFVVARKDAAGGVQPRVRAFFEKMVQENAGHSGASAVVISMSGFAGSLMRSFITSLLLLTGKRRMVRIFSTVDEACGWLAPLHGLDTATLVRVYGKATAHIGS